MATAAGGRRGKGRDNQFYDLGKVGRKTGISLPEGERDEHGLEDMDNIFSPDKPSEAPARGNTRRINGDSTLYSGDMDVGDSTIPEPTEVLTIRKTGVRMPPPRSKSPIKTFLHTSPVRGTPRVGAGSKPTVRQLDFSIDEGNGAQSPSRSPSQLKRPTKTPINAVSSLTNGTRLSPRTLQPAFEPNRSDMSNSDQENDSYAIVNGLNEDEPADASNLSEEPSIVDHAEPSPESVQPKRKQGRPTTNGTASAVAVKRGAGRPPATKRKAEIEDEETSAPVKKPRGRPKRDNSTETAGTTKATKKGMNKPTQKAKLPRSSLATELSPVVIHRGPSRPKTNNGLFILRHENEDERQHTRAGRRTIKPLAFWKGEHASFDFEEISDGLFLPSVTSVLRAEEVVQESTKRTGGGRKKGSKRSKHIKEVSDDEDEEDLSEPWEAEPGRIVGEIREWDPTDPTGIESQEQNEEIALSSAAIITRDIPGSTFKFAKTLTLPFFGSGMVDLPPGAVKKPKNSRKMQMVFFVFTGRVSVTVNDNTFRIGKGGMWQVPRGNFYSIENDYEKPARIFFSQGCEVLAEELEES